MQRMVDRFMICCVAIMLLACQAPEQVATDQSAQPIFQERGTATMTSMRLPEVHISANGTIALVDDANGGFQVYALPAATKQFSADAIEGFNEFILSSSGSTVAVRTFTSKLTLFSPEKQLTHQLPGDRGRIISSVLSDTGDRVALLVTTESQVPGAELKANGAVEIWALPPDAQPLARVPLSILDSGMMTANGDITHITVFSARSYGDQKVFHLLTYDPQQSSLVIVPAPEKMPAVPIRSAIYNQWVWMVHPDALIGWHETDALVQLPGAVGDKLIYSPDGAHLLAYRITSLSNNSTAHMEFRLIDLQSQTVVKQVTHTITQSSNAKFIVNNDLSLFEIQLNDANKPEAKELGW